MMSRLRWRRIAAAVAIAMTASVWAWSQPSTARAASAVVVPTACTVLTPPDLAGILGASFDAGSPTETANHTESACTWIHGSNTSRGYSLLLEIQGLGVSAFRDARTTAKGGKDNPYDIKFHAIKHFGNEAFSHQHRNPGFAPDNDLVVRQGAVIYSLVAPAKHVSVDQLKKLAALALTHK